MKLYLYILGIISILGLVSCEPPEEVKKMIQECAKEAGLPDELPKGLPNMDDPKLKCLTACLMKKKEILIDGNVSVEKAIEFFDKHIPGGATDAIKADMTECAGKANGAGDECAVASAFHKCMHEKHPNH